ncbi:acyltransferase family protein [Luteolibacter luteus]|uniref:Acyltransferase n=1 Tax=Luteolibacter luteus TaxID=2728835 RepID=A0A858RCF3_9BACT|nr:acyltransferase [Luteolibacter luteus]QJE94284.1 acyltransferase [Luteolibacter luteus]
MGLLRITLAIAVVLAHLQLGRSYMISGGQSVKVFFMISGFYMAMILKQKYGFHRRGLSDFAKNRFLRLYPLYLFIFAASIMWYQICVVATAGATPEPLLLEFSKAVPVLNSAWVWLVNLGLVGTDIPSLAHWNPQEGLLWFTELAHAEADGIAWMGSAVLVGQSWSIGAEIWFYIVSPLFVFLPRLWLKIAVWAALGYLTFHMQENHPRVSHFFWPGLFSYFATGALLFEVYLALSLGERSARWGTAVRSLIHASPLIWVLALPLAGVSLPSWGEYLVAALTIPFLFAATQRNRVDRAVGELSYGIYLNHMLVISVAAVLFKKADLPDFSFVPFVVVASLVFAWATYRLIEKPIERLRSRIAAKATKPAIQGSLGSI